jgi:hypothetical protein
VLITAPHLPGIAALVVIGAIYLAISAGLSVAPTWLLLISVIVAGFAIFIARGRGQHKVSHSITLVLIAATTVLVVSSAAILSTRLTGSTPGPVLLLDATLVWVANVLTFAVWYWALDAGGPHQRLGVAYNSQDLLFPQSTLTAKPEMLRWSPGFLDYLFLAFNTSTAFSPSDTLPLSRRIKLLMMLQTVVSLVVIVVLAARAINGLPG